MAGHHSQIRGYQPQKLPNTRGADHPLHEEKSP
jgi:hypothetical protein